MQNHLSSGSPTHADRITRVDAVGDRLSSGGPHDNSPFWRSVEVIITRHRVIDIPPVDIHAPIPRPRRRPVGSTHFRIRMTSAVSYEVFLTADFEIEDVVNHQTDTYRLEGIGPSLAPLPVPGGVTFSGPWNDFRTSSAMTVRDFGGRAEMDSVSDSKHLDWTGFVLSPVRCRSVHFWRFRTGRSEGLGVSVVRGSFFRHAVLPR